MSLNMIQKSSLMRTILSEGNYEVVESTNAPMYCIDNIPHLNPDMCEVSTMSEIVADTSAQMRWTLYYIYEALEKNNLLGCGITFYKCHEGQDMSTHCINIYRKDGKIAGMDFSAK